MHTAQTIVGLVVFKIYYELFRLGKEMVYNSDNGCSHFGGGILLTILTVGLYPFYAYFEFVCNNWNSGNNCKR